MATGNSLSGKDGKVKWGASSTEIKSTGWNINKQLETKDVTDSGSVDGKDFIPDGLYEWDGTFEGFMKGGIAKPTFGTVMDGIFEVDSAISFSGSIITTSEVTTLQVSGGDAVKVAFTFKGTGKLTETDTTS